MSEPIYLPQLVWDQTLDLGPHTTVAEYAAHCDAHRMDLLAVPGHLQSAVVAHQMGEVEAWHHQPPGRSKPEFSRREIYWGHRLFEGKAVEDDLERAGLSDREYLNAIAVWVDLEDGRPINQ